MSELKLKKLKMQTPDICEENIKKLKELFPQIVSEDKIDFDILKQLLSNSIVEADDERYRLDWVGKKRSLLKANTPINKTLRPCVEESVDFENTKNLYIEGDNFEVLKLLQESYLNKIKMIYIVYIFTVKDHHILIKHERKNLGNMHAVVRKGNTTMQL